MEGERRGHFHCDSRGGEGGESDGRKLRERDEKWAGGECIKTKREGEEKAEAGRRRREG